jgi:hypothetical protein
LFQNRRFNIVPEIKAAVKRLFCLKTAALIFRVALSGGRRWGKSVLSGGERPFLPENRRFNFWSRALRRRTATNGSGCLSPRGSANRLVATSDRAGDSFKKAQQAGGN